MKTLILAAALMAGASLASTSPAVAAARTYDCAKSGNANKAVCKTSAKTAAKAEAKAAKAQVKAAKVQASASAKAAKPATVSTRTATTARNYDCSKAGNANKQVCKGSMASARPVAARPATVSRPATARPTMTATRTSVATRRVASAGSASSENSSSAGAIAQCKDGLYSHAKARSGACARHGGVTKWM